MSIFSKLRGAKKAADAHKGAAAEKETKPVVPYKHIPTHAAIDALNGAPSSWREDDRALIAAQNKRRSQMIRSQSDISMATASTMNTTLNRPSSYTSNNSSSSEIKRQNRRTYLAIETVNQASLRTPFHGRSPLASHDISPVGSSSHSTSSSSSEISDLPTIKGEPAEVDIFAHMHKSTTRRVGEAPVVVGDIAPLPMTGPTSKSNIMKPTEMKKRKTWGFKRGNAAAVAVH
ncbi:MAG: hypothetical protein MMC33_003758 [Icmadophila ericetorum]|nr:hypothetical protein [Icmadophila ericetorum]